MAVRGGIKETAASRSLSSNYSSLSKFMRPAGEWAPKLRDKGMISDTTFGCVTNPAAFVDEGAKAIAMLKDVEAYIRSSNPVLFWYLVRMIHEKERAQAGGRGRLAQTLAAAYKKNGGGDEIDSALTVSGDQCNATKGSGLMSEQPLSSCSGPPHPDSTPRSRSEPALPARQHESSNGTQGVLVTSSPEKSSRPSLYAIFAGYAINWRDVLWKYAGPLAVGAILLLFVAIGLGMLGVGKKSR